MNKNNIKNFEEFNESWRQWKFKLGLPIYILDGLNFTHKHIY